MPPVEAPPAVVAEVQNEDTISKPMVGIIYPPPEVRNIVDKTASFVARNGPSFEERIKGNEVDNPKFNFLTPTDPYHAYYQHKVKEFGEGKATDSGAPPSARPSAIPRTLPTEAAKIIQEPAVPKEAPPEPEFICDPPSISAFDLDVVKLTAQFVARNGRQFLTNLMNKEQRNYQFDFLRPQHSLFNYFTKLVEQYTKVLIPPKDLTEKLKKESDNPKEVLKQVNDRVLWAKHQEQEKRKVEEKKEKERVAYAQIDWHDFVVVETVDYQPNEVGHFPTPTTPDEVGARVLMQERIDADPDAAPSPEPEAVGEDEDEKSDEKDKEDTEEKEDEVEMELSDKEDQAEDMEEASDDEIEMPPPKAVPGQPPMPAGQPLLPSSAKPVIVRPYDPKQPRPAPPPPSDQFLISPLTQEKIPAHKMQEHMKISLLDPKWREQKERQIREKKEQETVYDTGVNIEVNLRGIAERRTDIFGVGGEEAEIGKKIGEVEHKSSDHVVWDGHSASMDKVSQQARAKYTIEDQIMSIHQTKGLVEDESKNKIGPSVTKTGPPKPPAQPIPPPPASKTIVSAAPPPPASRPPAAVPPPPQGVAPVQLRLAPQGVPAPPIMMAPRPSVVMVQPRPPQPMMPPRPVLGVPLGAPLGSGLAPVPQVLRPVLPPAPVVVQQMPAMPPQLSDEPPSKRAKTEESLIPEHQWLGAHPNNILINVQVPRMADKPEWRLNGQILAFTFAPTETCASIKSKISDELGMPVGKQKLQYEGLFIKDSNTLAFYNFLPSSIVQLSTKERGGRKK